jgi:hypothetical protein
MSRKFIWTVVVLAGLACAAGGTAFGQLSVEDAGRMALSQHALRSHEGQGGYGYVAPGPDVTLNIIFPDSQTGLDNIEMVDLVPGRCRSIGGKVIGISPRRASS